MKGLLIPLAMALAGVGAGVGAGFALKPTPVPPEDSGAVAPGSAAQPDAEAPAGDDSAVEFARLNNQFIVPVIDGEKVAALVVLSVTLEVAPGGTETVFQNEPRLRDRFLRVLFDHANIGGFDSGFTQTGTMAILRNALLESARETLGLIVRDVLIVDIVRQEV